MATTLFLFRGGHDAFWGDDGAFLDDPCAGGDERRDEDNDDENDDDENPFAEGNENNDDENDDYDVDDVVDDDGV